MIKKVAQSSVLQKYLGVLNVNSLRTLEENIIASVMEATGHVHAPVRLAPHVSKFLINPRPIYSAAVENGRLEYDPHSKRFNIVLRKVDGVTAKDEPASGRLRFTYAHEVGHRFCFVDRNGEWQRAVQIVISNLGGAARIRALRSLTMFEERLCNDVAARLLIPDEMLKQMLEPLVHSQFQPSLADVIVNIASTFHVTRQCAIVRLQKAIRRGIVHMVDGFCAFLLVCGSEAGFGGPKPIVKTSIFPRLLEGKKVQSVFPGGDIGRFGGDLCVTAKGFIEHREGVFESSITVHMEDSLRNLVPIQRTLSGSWTTIGRKGFSEGGSVLL